MTHVAGGIGDAGKGVLNGVIGAINGFLAAVSNIAISVPGGEIPLAPDLPGFTIGFPNLPQLPSLATGGHVPAVTGGMLARLAEGGEGEHIIGDRKLREVLAEMGGRGGGETHVHVHLGEGATADVRHKCCHRPVATRVLSRTLRR